MPLDYQSLYTIGHSNHAADKFLSLLQAHGINILVDVLQALIDPRIRR